MSRGPSTAVLLAAAADVARECGRVALQHFRSPDLVVQSKPNGSPVTNADLASEAAAREWIRSRFPGDGILGEEFGLERAEATRRWVLDPIDGTRTYVRGVPLWGSLVAVLEGEEILAGAANFPALGELICAAPGENCWLNDTKTRVSNQGRVDGALVLTTDPKFAADERHRPGWQQLELAAEMSRSWGDCYGYLLVASGRAEVMVDPMLSQWDAAAFLPVVEEAGGVFTDWAGARTAAGGNAIATNAALSDTVRRLLGFPASGGAR
jgi:histidinol phosphatase-like enzyme (inositol monophosphatase family)